MFPFNWLVIIWKGWGWKALFEIGRGWTRGMEGLENWTIFMDVICIVPSLTNFIVILPLYFEILGIMRTVTVFQMMTS